jgi:hypothetical protein
MNEFEALGAVKLLKYYEALGAVKSMKKALGAVTHTYNTIMKKPWGR